MKTRFTRRWTTVLLALALGLLATRGLHAQATRGYRIALPAPSSIQAAGTVSEQVEKILRGQHLVHVRLGPPKHAIEVGDFMTRAEALVVLRTLRQRGLEGEVIRTSIQTRRLPEEAAAPVPVEAVAAELAAAEPVAAEPVVAEPIAAEPGATEPVAAEPVAAEPPTQPAPPLSTATYQGFHGNTSCDATFGWIWNPERPDERVLVDLYDGDRLVGTVVADGARPDLAAAGIGDGAYGFRFGWEAGAEGPVMLEARVGGTPIPLRGTPRVNPCRADEVPADVLLSMQAPKTPSAQDPTANAAPGGPSTASPGASSKAAVAVAIGPGEVTLDGRLDEPIWVNARFLSDFQQQGLDRGFERPEWTRVAFAFDEDALYVGARMEGPAGTPTDARVGRRDDPGNADQLLVSLDTYDDGRTAYTFGVTAGGARLDHFHPEDREFPRDDGFDPVWEARTVADSSGWTAELRIPFNQLRFAEGQRQSWGVNVRRWNPQELMNLYWVVVPMAEQGWASRFGRLEGIEGVGSASRVEIAPYVVRGFRRPTGSAPGDENSTLRFGGDVKVGFGPDLTLDGTVLPDFGQVEADPADVNLTAFETTFAERRPFFAEGSALVGGRGPRYFYSRRIGAVPHGTDPGNALDLPTNTEILGATKLTSRLGSGERVGGLMAITSREVATIPGNTPENSASVVAPTTGFAVGRIERDLGPSGSTLGLTLTSVHRSMEGGSIPETVLARDAFSGGFDGNLRFAANQYELSGHGGFSSLRGDPRAISWIQRSSAHYFQRPDADHVDFDASRASLSGYTAGLGIKKIAGANWTWAAAAGVESPGFNIRDAGILRSADHRDLFASVGYRQAIPGRVLRYYSATASADVSWNYGGVRQFLSPALSFSGAFPNLWRTYARVSYEAPALSDELTQGGVLMGTPAALDFATGLSSSFASNTGWTTNVRLRRDDFGGWYASVDGGLSVRAGRHVEASLAPGYSRQLDTRQYYGMLPGGPASTLGRREIFSSLSRSEIYVQGRLDIALNPDVSLQLYVEPFASSGDYFDFGELTRAGGDSLRVYGSDGTTIQDAEFGSRLVRDGTETFTLWPVPFNVRSFRSNAVLRWDWRPGSSLFLIWQQSRWGYEEQGTRVQTSALRDAIRDPGENLFTVKFSTRLGVR